MTEYRSTSGQSHTPSTTTKSGRPSVMTRIEDTATTLFQKLTTCLTNRQQKRQSGSSGDGATSSTSTSTASTAAAKDKLSSWMSQTDPTSWSLDEADRPAMSFGQGGIAQIIDNLPKLRADSVGAVVAVVRFVAMHQPHTSPLVERDRERAANELTRLLTQICPNPTSVANAEARRQEMRRSPAAQGRLTADLTYWEQIYLQFVHGQPTTQSLSEMTRQLESIADNLAKANSQRRQATTRIMLADVLLQQKQFGRANQEMAIALTLMGTIYPNQELINLAMSIDATKAEQTIAQRGNGATSPTMPGTSRTRQDRPSSTTNQPRI